MILKILLGLSLIGALSSCVTVPPNVEACASLTDPFDPSIEDHKGFCKFTLSSRERELSGEKWKDRVRTGVVIDMDQWELFTIWARSQCAKTNNECVLKK
jgi:hypothetical protein